MLIQLRIMTNWLAFASRGRFKTFSPTTIICLAMANDVIIELFTAQSTRSVAGINRQECSEELSEKKPPAELALPLVKEACWEGGSQGWTRI